jgi:leader peptidase (prepilin peptidase)/N-methyltransferase
MVFQFSSVELIGAFLLGTIIGSFANVCIYRLPWHRSLIFPASHCPHCQQSIRPQHNIPILSYLFLGGRCAYCQINIPWRYPFVELLCGLLYVFLYKQFGVSIIGVVLTTLATILLIVTFIDLDHQIIPDVITVPGIAAGLLASSFLTPIGVLNALIGTFLGGGLFFLVAVLSRGGMGGGDIKLIAMIGAFLGWQAVLVTIFLSALLGACVGIFLILFKKKGRKDPVPFGPFLAMGAIMAMVWGTDLIYFYAHFSH